MFTGIDWLTMSFYLGIVAAIGVFFSRRHKDVSGYLFGGGKMPWPAIGISLIATSVSATTFLGNPADAFKNDMTLLMLNLGVFLAIIVIAFVFIPRLRNAGIQSAYELLERAFSRDVRLTAASFYSLHLLLRTGILIYGPAFVLAEMFGIDLLLAIVLMAVMATGYTYLGGLQAVVWTDVLQFVVLFGGGIWVLVVCANGVGGFGEMAAMAGEAEKTRWLDWSLDPTEARNILSAGLIYTFFEVAIRGCDQQFVQRYLACKDVRRANYSSILSAVLGLAVGLLFYWVGAGMSVYFGESGAAVLPEGTEVNQVFPYFILNVLPAGMTGLLVAAVFAAAMSSLDSAITALANTTVQDFLPKSGLNDAQALARARKWTLIWGVVGTLAAMVCVLGQQSLLTKALFFTSLFIGPLLGLFLFAFFRPSTRPAAVVTGAILGMVTLMLFSNIPILPKGVWEPLYPFAWPWNPVLSLAGMTIGVFLTDSLLARREGAGRA